MMTRQERAKQFMPFDAMKGLQEALRDREERHSRVERRTVSDEKAEEISNTLVKVGKGSRVEILYYHAFHEVLKKGRVGTIDFTLRYMVLGEEKIQFDDLYDLRILDI